MATIILCATEITPATRPTRDTIADVFDSCTLSGLQESNTVVAEANSCFFCPLVPANMWSDNLKWCRLAVRVTNYPLPVVFIIARLTLTGQC